MKNVRNTQAQLEILKLINESETALTHAFIQQKLGDLCDRVTIYRVLERLVEEGQIHRFVNMDGVVNFANCVSCKTHGYHHNHLHFNCKNCKSVICLEKVMPQLEIPAGYQIEDYNFVVSGICARCTENS